MTLTPQQRGFENLDRHRCPRGPNIVMETGFQWEKLFITHPSDFFNILVKGLNFAVTLRQIPLVELITATETAIRNNNIAEVEAEQLRTKVSACLSNAKPPTSNITMEERKALTTLSDDNNIIILPADKGRCTVLLNQKDYYKKILSLLSDENTNEPLKRDPGSGYRKRAIDCLKQLEQDKAIDRTSYHRLYPGESTPSLYGSPKIHKQGAPLRPIVCMIDFVTYNISKFLASILKLVGCSEHHIQNTLDFVEKVRDVIMEADETSPVSPIVANLYMEEEAEEQHIKKALSKCGYPNWTFVKAGKAPKKSSS
ncbi:uncharacterized protein LOC120736595 [Simochromis diagramma]|uniref:uncharacterized protein LOC120736595 n=1 Tax=Simochromis diagramma TaxID=43689 RepID=UPI001A7EEB34|nr:uncharacterized protein LOC120736595 [Simochromis diagramma]